MPYGPAAKKVLELTFREALRLGHNYIGTEHLLLALLEHENGEGTLSGLGLTKERTEAYVTEVLAEFLETTGAAGMPGPPGRGAGEASEAGGAGEPGGAAPGSQPAAGGEGRSGERHEGRGRVRRPGRRPGPSTEAVDRGRRPSRRPRPSSGGVVRPSCETRSMADRWALAVAEDGGVEVAALGPDGLPAGPVRREADPAEAVRSRPEVTRWVWRSTAEVYPRLLAAGVRVERCYDVEDAEVLLLGHEGGTASPGRPPPPWPGCAAVRCRPTRPSGPPNRARSPRCSSRRGPGSRWPTSSPSTPISSAGTTGPRTRPDAAADRGRVGGMLVAAEMNHAGLPWRADVHREVLHDLLGERYAGGGEPRRLAELAEEVSAAFGRRVRPDLPADVIKAFAQAGITVRSTRRWEIESVDHPAVKPLVEYKKLYRIWVAHGWSWLQDWVRDGRFRPEFLAGGTVTGRWVTNGGGGLQIPKVIRRAVVADPAGAWSWPTPTRWNRACWRRSPGTRA